MTASGEEYEQWTQSPHWPVGPWYLRRSDDGEYVAYQESSWFNPLWSALIWAVMVGRMGCTLDLPPGITLDDIDSYARRCKTFLGQEIRISLRQAEEFSQILRSSVQYKSEMTALAAWATDAALRHLPE